MRFFVIVLLLPILAVSMVTQADGASGAGGPSWLTSAEVCNGWYKQWTDDAIAAMRDTPFVIGVPMDKKIIDKAHAEGVKVLHYVTFYQMPPKEKYQGALLSDHPDWVVIRPDGKEGISVFDSSDNPGWKTLCPNSPAYRDYVLSYVKGLMAQGIDGLFIDNGHPDVNCDGPKFGRHKHLYPGKDNVYAYRKLLEDVRAVVKAGGRDKIIIVNPGYPNKAWLGACDGQMLESYICTWAADHRWHDQAKLLGFLKEWGPAADEGNAVVALSYIGNTKNPPREDAFYCYCWARLSGFIWADWFTANDTASCLYKLRLGRPISPMRTGNNCYYREFEHGIVVVSDESHDAVFHFSAEGRPVVFDVFAAKHLKPCSSAGYEIRLGKGQGRVFTY